MENFLRKYGWTLTLALIAVGASLLALMANNIVASQLAPFTVPKLPKMAATHTSGPPPGVRRLRSRDWDRTIASLCLFGCSDEKPKDECPGGCPDGQSCQQGQCVPTDQPASDSDVPVLSDLNMKLTGAMVAHPNEYSMALVRDDNTHETMVVSPGDMVADGAELVEIRRDRLIIKRNGHLEYIRMDKTIGGEPSAQTPVSTLTPTPSLSGLHRPSLSHPRSLPVGAPVKKVDRDKYQVSRSAIKNELNNKKQLASEGRVVPNFKNGKREGLKLVGLSPNSVYTKLGIQSGDVLRAVNGHKITTSQQALDLFEKLKSEREVSVEIERRGQKRHLEYKIH